MLFDRVLVLVSCVGYAVCKPRMRRVEESDYEELMKNGPEQIDYQRILQLYDIKHDVTFVLYTRDSPRGETLKNSTSLQSSHFDPSKETKFVTHGFQSSLQSDTCQTIKNAYLKHKDVNVIVMDWSPIAANIIYPVVAMLTDNIGRYYATFVDALVNYGADPKRMHLIGHSLGAHISGFAGRWSQSTLGRITGLDPAGPSFATIQLAGSRLDKSDAEFVDVIHTSAGTLGLMSAIGDVDFYPNGGVMSQPGCNGPDEILNSCSHGRSWMLFQESIDPKHEFWGWRCRNYGEFQNNRKNCTQKALMGEYVEQTMQGIYYLGTNGAQPFAIIIEL